MKILYLIGAIAVLALLPLYVSEYQVGLLLGAMTFIVLANGWALFSGYTRYISLATVAFYGTGIYVVAVLNEVMPYPLVLLCVVLIAAGAAMLVGLSTLRLSGSYFVIFSFGLAEFIRQLITWYEVNVSGALGRYIFMDLSTIHIYWQMLALAVLTLGIAMFIRKRRLGLALRAIGDDETVASHAGVPLAQTKLLVFVISSVIIALAGAIVSPRWVYVEPSIAFNPNVSFLTVIMALLGGAHRLWGPTVGVIALFFVFEWLSINFTESYTIILGALFIAVVFALPDGLLPGLEKWWKGVRTGRVSDE